MIICVYTSIYIYFYKSFHSDIHFPRVYTQNSMYVVDNIDKYFWQTYSALYPILCEKGVFDKMRALYMVCGQMSSHLHIWVREGMRPAALYDYIYIYIYKCIYTQVQICGVCVRNTYLVYILFIFVWLWRKSYSMMCARKTWLDK